MGIKTLHVIQGCPKNPQVAGTYVKQSAEVCLLLFQAQPDLAILAIHSFRKDQLLEKG